MRWWLTWASPSKFTIHYIHMPDPGFCNPDMSSFGFETALLYEDPIELLDPYYTNQEAKPETSNYQEADANQLFPYKQEDPYANGTFKSVRNTSENTELIIMFSHKCHKNNWLINNRLQYDNIHVNKPIPVQWFKVHRLKKCGERRILKKWKSLNLKKAFRLIRKFLTKRVKSLFQMAKELCWCQWWHLHAN